MAIRHLTAVARADLSGTDLAARMIHPVKSVLKVFADHANDSDTSWPHRDTIALEAGLDPASVSRATNAAVEARLLLKRRTATGNHYRLNMGLIGELYMPPKRRYDPDFDEARDQRTSSCPQAPQGSDQPKWRYATSHIALRNKGNGVTQQGMSRNATQNHQGTLKEPTINQRARDDDDESSATDNQPKADVTGHIDAARELLAGLEMPHGSAFDPHAKAVMAVAKQLALGAAREDVQLVLTAEIANANTPAAVVSGRCQSLRTLLDGHGSKRAAAEPARRLLPACHKCGAEHGTPAVQRQVENADNEQRKCSSCHPDVVVYPG